jgi:hypothetical protein
MWRIFPGPGAPKGLAVRGAEGVKNSVKGSRKQRIKIPETYTVL